MNILENIRAALIMFIALLLLATAGYSAGVIVGNPLTNSWSNYSAAHREMVKTVAAFFAGMLIPVGLYLSIHAVHNTPILHRLRWSRFVKPAVFILGLVTFGAVAQIATPSAYSSLGEWTSMFQDWTNLFQGTSPFREYTVIRWFIGASGSALLLGLIALLLGRIVRGSSKSALNVADDGGGAH